MEKYKDDLSEDIDIIWLEGEEHEISDVWLLSLESGFNGATCSYQIVKDFCKQKKLDIIEVFRVCKTMTDNFNSKG